MNSAAIKSKEAAARGREKQAAAALINFIEQLCAIVCKYWND